MTKIYKHARRKYMHHLKIYLHFDGDEMVNKLVLNFVFYNVRHTKAASGPTFSSVGLKSSLGFE